MRPACSRLRPERGGAGPRRYVRNLREHRGPTTARPLDAAALENVVITGGNGAIGLRYARYCIERGARRADPVEPQRYRIRRSQPADRAASRGRLCAALRYHRPVSGRGRRGRIRGGRRVIADSHGRNRRRVPARGADRCRRGRSVRRESLRLGRDDRRVAPAAGMPDPGLLFGVRRLGWPRQRCLCGVESNPRRACRATAVERVGLHRDSMGTLAGRRSGRGGGDRPYRALRAHRDATRVGGGRQPRPVRQRSTDFRRRLRPVAGLLRKPGNSDAVSASRGYRQPPHRTTMSTPERSSTSSAPNWRQPCTWATRCRSTGPRR